MGTGLTGSAGVRTLLEQAELRPLGYLAGASNHTLLCQVGEESLGVHAVYKPRDGERPLWDFPPGTLCQREVAAHVVSDFLGWDIVPPTVLRDGPLGEGSVQLFIPHDPRRHYFVLVEEDSWDEELARMAVFDLLVNNTDRKASHVLLSEEDRIRGIDHGVTFHPQPKLRTVIWEFGGTPIDEGWRADLRRLAAALSGADGARTRQEVSGANGPRTGRAVTEQLCGLLSAREVAVTAARAEALTRAPALPDLDEERRPYPWPPL